MALAFDTSDVLASAPSVVVYGAPGIGKTLSMAEAFPTALYVQSNPTILRAHAHWSALHPELKWATPPRVTIDEKTVTAWGGSYVGALTSVINDYIALCDAGKSPFSGIVFDEWNVFCERIFAELKTDPWGKFKGRNGALNIFQVFDAFKQVHRSILSVARRTRKMVGFVCHYQGPKYDEDESSPMKGQLKWPGGPKMPMGLSDQVVELCADADVVVQLLVRDASGAALLDASQAGKVQRVLATQVDPKWFRKVRGFGIQAEEPIDIEKGKGLREVLVRAGFRV